MSQLRRDDVDRFFDFNLHLSSRTLFMGTEVDEDGEMAELFLKGMTLLEPTRSPITVIMNNMGGDEYNGLAIYDAIATSKCHITVKVFGHAMSMGSWILQAADERLMSPRAMMMLHIGSNSYRTPAEKRELDRLDDMMMRCYMENIQRKHPHYKLATLRKRLEADWYITAAEAVELGLADGVLDE